MSHNKHAATTSVDPTTHKQPQGTPVAEIDLAVTGMTCAACVARVEKKLNKLEGVQAVVNLATERAHVELFGDITDSQLVETVERAGYGATVVRRVEGGKAAKSDIDAREAEAAATEAGAARRADLRKRFIVALVASIPVVALSMVVAWEFPGWQWLVVVLATVVAFWCGWPFHRAALRAARHGSTTMDTLVSLGVIASMGWSYWALLFGGAGRIGYTMKMSGAHSTSMPHLYCESAAMIVTFLLLGRLLEARSRRSAGDALRSLFELGARKASLIGDDGSERVIEAANVQVGDVFRVRPGEKIATDGIVVAGAGAVDMSLLTGESVPVSVGVGDEVTGAAVNTDGTVDVRATRVGEETTLAAMGRLVAQAQTGKAPIQRLADRVSAVFVPVVIVIAVVTFLVRTLILGNPIEVALTSAIAVLVVACPCALGLATPTALLVGSGRASKEGILLRGAEVLEKARGVDTMVLDKTGTLTTGQMSVVDAVTSTHELSIAAGLEAYSEHPVARAIVAAAHKQAIEPASVVDVHTHAGAGIEARLADSGTSVLIGSLDWLRSHEVDVLGECEEACARCAADGATVSVLAVDGEAVAVYATRDELRPDAADAVAELKRGGVEPILVTGDNEATARVVAAEVGIDAVKAGVKPGEKLQCVEELRASGQRVAMAGDGVNDAPALAGADVSIAMGSGTDVAKAASDITIVGSSLRAIPRALEIAAATLRVVRQNLGWAFAYNIVAIPLAVTGVVVPGVAAAAMAASSVIVVMNSLRLRHHPK